MSDVRRPRRGLVLFAVLLLVGSAVLVATAVVFIVGGEVAGGASERETLRLRAAALSAVEAVAAKLGSQRTVMLEGGTPIVDATLELWESGGETATARLLPVDTRGSTLVAEPAKAPLGLATIESLVATGAMDEGLAGRIVALRDAGARLLSIDALLSPRGGSDGLTVEELFGPVDGLVAAAADDPRRRRDLALAATTGAGAGETGTRPVRELLTTFAFEPPVRFDGSPRLRIDGEWTDDHRGEVDAALGSGSAAILEAAMKEGEPTVGSLFAAWRTKHADPKEWHAFLDAVTLGDGPLEGRIDIQHADVESLRSLPGITKEQAERIAREREGLGAESRRSIAWLAERDVLPAETCAALVDRATTRSFLWRVRVAATIARGRDDAALRPPVVLEAVVDCSGARPRIALLRDLSGLETVARMLAAAERENAGRGAMERDEFDSDPLGAEPGMESMPEESVETPEPEPEPEVEPAPGAGGSSAAPPEPAAPAGVPPRHGVGRWRRSQ